MPIYYVKYARLDVDVIGTLRKAKVGGLPHRHSVALRRDDGGAGIQACASALPAARCARFGSGLGIRLESPASLFVLVALRWEVGGAGFRRYVSALPAARCARFGSGLGIRLESPHCLFCRVVPGCRCGRDGGLGLRPLAVIAQIVPLRGSEGRFLRGCVCRPTRVPDRFHRHKNTSYTDDSPGRLSTKVLPDRRQPLSYLEGIPLPARTHCSYVSQLSLGGVLGLRRREW